MIFVLPLPYEYVSGQTMGRCSRDNRNLMGLIFSRCQILQLHQNQYSCTGICQMWIWHQDSALRNVMHDAVSGTALLEAVSLTLSFFIQDARYTVFTLCGLSKSTGCVACN